MSQQLIMMSDVLFRDAVDPDRLRIVASRAFGIAPVLVAVADSTGSDPIPDDARVVMLHESQDMPGDFPVWYGMSVDPDLADRAGGAVSAIARSLDTVLLTDAEDEQDMTLHLPDGSGHVVHLEQDDDDAFRITPEMRWLIERATRRDAESGSRHSRTRKALAG